MDLCTDLKVARRMGSAKGGSRHWWGQRVSARALLPLSLWFAVAVVAHSRSDYAAVVAWAGSPVSAVLLGLFLVATLYHVVLGLLVVI